MLLTLGICSGSAGSICDGAVCKYIYENPPGNGEMLFLSPIRQAVLLIFAGILSKARIVLFAHALDTSAQRALCDNNAKTDD